jgi:hypothetical protein
MKKRATWKSCCILMSVAIAIAPVIHAADQEPIHMAKAIGEESTTAPTTPKKKTKPPTSKEKTVPVTPEATPVEKAVEAPVEKKPDAATESEPISNTAIYIGIGIAVLLAAAGGGGGGGGSSSSSTPPHP